MNWINASVKPKNGTYLTRVEVVYTDKEIGNNGLTHFFNVNEFKGEWEGEGYTPKICERMEITHYCEITPPKQ